MDPASQSPHVFNLEINFLITSCFLFYFLFFIFRLQPGKTFGIDITFGEVGRAIAVRRSCANPATWCKEVASCSWRKTALGRGQRTHEVFFSKLNLYTGVEDSKTSDKLEAYMRGLCKGFGDMLFLFCTCYAPIFH